MVLKPFNKHADPRSGFADFLGQAANLMVKTGFSRRDGYRIDSQTDEALAPFEGGKKLSPRHHIHPLRTGCFADASSQNWRGRGRPESNPCTEERGREWVGLELELETLRHPLKAGGGV